MFSQRHILKRAFCCLRDHVGIVRFECRGSTGPMAADLFGGLLPSLQLPPRRRRESKKPRNAAGQLCRLAVSFRPPSAEKRNKPNSTASTDPTAVMISTLLSRIVM